jgi:hypothetical protein
MNIRRAVLVAAAAISLAGCSSPVQQPPATPVTSASAGVTAAPPRTTTAATAPSKYVYRVEGNYRATQLHYTASNGDDIDLNHTNNINTAGSALPWTETVTPEPNGNPQSLSASTLSAKGDSYITCTISDEQGRVVATNTGRGAYAGCYASTI